MSKILSSIAFTVLIILSIGLVSAEDLANKTVVNGVVYQYPDVKVPNANVTVTCNGILGGPNVTNSQGAYAMLFDIESCGLGKKISGIARFGDKVATQPEVSLACGDGSGCAGSVCTFAECKNSSFIILMNFIFDVPVQPPVVVVSGGGGGGGGGSGFRAPTQNNTNSTSITNIVNVAENNVTEIAEDTEVQTPGFLARITGAVVGVFGNAGTGVIFVVLILLAGSFIALRVRKNVAGKAKVAKTE